MMGFFMEETRDEIKSPGFRRWRDGGMATGDVRIRLSWLTLPSRLPGVESGPDEEKEGKSSHSQQRGGRCYILQQRRQQKYVPISSRPPSLAKKGFNGNYGGSLLRFRGVHPCFSYRETVGLGKVGLCQVP